MERLVFGLGFREKRDSTFQLVRRLIQDFDISQRVRRMEKMEAYRWSILDMNRMGTRQRCPLAVKAFWQSERRGCGRLRTHQPRWLVCIWLESPTQCAPVYHQYIFITHSITFPRISIMSEPIRILFLVNVRSTFSGLPVKFSSLDVMAFSKATNREGKCWTITCVNSWLFQ